MVRVVIIQGQAQECFVEKSLKGVGRVKNNTVAKLAARVRILMHKKSSKFVKTVLYICCIRYQTTTANVCVHWRVSHAISLQKRTRIGQSCSK